MIGNIAADKIDLNLAENLDNSGVIQSKDQTQIHSTNITNRDDGQMIGSGEINLTATKDIVNQSSTISGNNVLVFAGGNITDQTTSQTISGGEQRGIYPSWNGTNTVIGQKGAIISSGNLTVSVGKDIAVNGGAITAAGDVAVQAGNNVTVDSVAAYNHVLNTERGERYERSSVTNVTGEIQGGKNVSVSSGGDMTLTGAQVNAGQNLNVAAQGNIRIAAVKDSKSDDQQASDKKQYHARSTYDETVIGSNLEAAGNVSIQSGAGNISLVGSNVSSDQGKITVAAAKDITETATTERHERSQVDRVTSSGLLSTTTTETGSHSLVDQVKGSTVSGDQVDISAGKDLNIAGSNLAGTNDVNLTAQDVTITSAKEKGDTEQYSYSKTSGIFSGGGLGITIGSKSEKISNTEKTLDEVGSVIGSTSGNVTVKASDAVTSEGTSFIAGKDVSIEGKNVTIENGVNTVDSQTKYEFKQSGLSVSLGGGGVTSLNSAAADVRRSGQVADDRLKALYNYKAVEDGKEALNGLKQPVSIGVSVGSSSYTSESDSHRENVNPSGISAGANAGIQADEGDVNLQGVNIAGTNVTIQAKGNVNIKAAENIEEDSSKSSNSSWSVGGNIGIGYEGNKSQGSSRENERAVSYQESTVTAQQTATLTAGGDANISGSKVTGDKVTANVGGNLNIASLQDSDNYASKDQNSGIGIANDGGGSVTGSLNQGKMDSTYQSVTNQAGIYAGKDGFDIQVGKNTDLKGAVIASDATPDKNKLSTDTLTYSDIQNKADYSASIIGVNYNTGKDVATKEQGLTPNIGVTASGKSDSTTKSAISPGTIIVRSNPGQDLSTLSRDTNNSLNVLGKIFDKKTVQEQQELAQVFGEEAFKAVGDLGLKEGSPEKVALDAFAGGLMAKLGGGNFASGAAGAGINQIVQSELAKITDPAAHQWASALVGGIAAKLVGGDAQTGASVAASETKNNNEAHDELQRKLAARKTAMALERADKFNQLDSDYYVWGMLLYVLRDDEGVVKYVGRSDDPVRRATEHEVNPEKAGLHMDVLTEEPVSYAEGRGLEQYVFEYFGGKDKLLNKIRPVNTDRTWGQFLRNLGADVFKRLKL